MYVCMNVCRVQELSVCVTEVDWVVFAKLRDWDLVPLRMAVWQKYFLSKSKYGLWLRLCKLKSRVWAKNYEKRTNQGNVNYLEKMTRDPPVLKNHF